MAGSHDLSFVAVRGASSGQIYRRVIFARYLPRGKVSSLAYSPDLGRNQSTYAPLSLSPSHILILFSRMLRCPFRSWPTNALRQTLNKYLFPLFIPYSNVRIVYSFFPVSLLLFVDTHEETHTHTHTFPLPFCLSPRVVYREYKLDFGIIVGGSPSWLKDFDTKGFRAARNVAAFTRRRDIIRRRLRCRIRSV